MADNSKQIVYVLTNPAMVGLVKIGKTSQFEVKERMKQLYGTGVPVPFDCAFACQVKDASEVEKALHFAFGNTRLNPSREFFKIEPERVIAVLKLLKVDDITLEFEQQLTTELDAVDKQSGLNLKNTKRPLMNFHALGIPDGSVLVSKDGTIQVIVAGERKVSFEGAVCSLIVPTRKLLNLALDYPIQPSPYWTFNGNTVKEIYEAFHNELNSD
ncbi:GIY-YIG nuclease family protein [Glaciimonas sp. PAMC28666]|uniref:GIY-YIG nuclease family protein n=1 Tax=Glaciimonas sp. PAMC28666 TaxID=2807626 RepID=UPI0019659C16|nr:GIY-YIG nuclease family protein [Glaciimonas sp. PAMC28666]QRX83587.1 GIY-YIG nuclease family protein [Glaciimonas sp. PAMC28666]